MRSVLLRVYGIVQGVGFRPTVARHAQACQVTGYVCNKGPYVEIAIEGEEHQVDKMIDCVIYEPPKQAMIIRHEVFNASLHHYSDFQIVTSQKTKGEIYISPDLAICDDCVRELYDPHNRRYLHPFINCTNCGPRLTILEGLPYDRERTSMKAFPMCPECEKEYHDPQSRFYDAQPVSCHECGPEVYILGHEEIREREAIIYTRQALKEGKIVAIKGIGGFHLAVDAKNEKAVSRLRALKHRPRKPFAVMAKNLTTVKSFAHVSKAQEAVLTGVQKPICLLEKKGSCLAESVAPGNPKVGVMLPYAPLQHLLFRYDDGLKTPDVLIMTSANDSGAPIVHNDEEALAECASLCDVILSHNRVIRIRCDDSVMDFYHDAPYMIRRSRGYAPLPYYVSTPYEGAVLAIGGELKNTFCIGKNQLLYPSSYIGDLSDIRSVKSLQSTMKLMTSLLEVDPDLIVCDPHPQYNTKRVGESLGKEVVHVQHHYAHILSCMAENDVHDKVIGVAFDGTGYGDDGTIWGGEIFICDPLHYKRVSHIQPFLQLGGDASSLEGYRGAVSMLLDLYDDPQDLVMKLGLCDLSHYKVLRAMHARKLNAVTSTSAGRLFDAISAILGLCLRSTYEGEAATALQFAALQGKRQTLSIDVKAKQDLLPTKRLVAEITKRRLNGEDVHDLAYLFHDGLAQMIVSEVIRIAQNNHLQKVALSGGCFQNTLLLALVETRLKEAGFCVYIHHLLPPNDGGIACGQAYYGLACLKERRNDSCV